MMKMRTAAFLAAFGAAFLAAGSASAQSAYVGRWEYKGCHLQLETLDPFGTGRAETNFCSGEMAFASQWRALPDGIMLMNAAGSNVARMWWDGSTLYFRSAQNTNVVFHREGGGGRGDTRKTPFQMPEFQIPDPFARRSNPRPSGNGNGNGCVTIGNTNRCAPRYELQVPNTIARNAPFDGRSAQVRATVNLAFRAGPSLDTPVYFRIPEGTCFPLHSCTDTPKGTWCMSRLNGKFGYVTKVFTRPDGHRIVTYTNGCGQANR